MKTCSDRLSARPPLVKQLPHCAGLARPEDLPRVRPCLACRFLACWVCDLSSCMRRTRGSSMAHWPTRSNRGHVCQPLRCKPTTGLRTAIASCELPALLASTTARLLNKQPAAAGREAACYSTLTPSPLSSAEGSAKKCAGGDANHNMPTTTSPFARRLTLSSA
jgi:hypothetical protein